MHNKINIHALTLVHLFKWGYFIQENSQKVARLPEEKPDNEKAGVDTGLSPIQKKKKASKKGSQEDIDDSENQAREKARSRKTPDVGGSPTQELEKRKR